MMRGESREVKLFVVVLLAVAVWVCADLYAMHRRAQEAGGPPMGPDPNVHREMLLAPGSPVRGDPKAPFTLVVFTDYQCPACRSSRLEVDRLLKQNAGRMNVVVRAFQASLSHPHAPLLARAAWAAGMQGRYGEMHDRLLEKQDLFAERPEAQARREVARIARALKLDMPRFLRDMESKPVRDAWERDADIARRVGIFGRPSFYFVPPKGDPIRLTTLTQAREWLADPRHWE